MIHNIRKDPVGGVPTGSLCLGHFSLDAQGAPTVTLSRAASPAVAGEALDNGSWGFLSLPRAPRGRGTACGGRGACDLYDVLTAESHASLKAPPPSRCRVPPPPLWQGRLWIAVVRDSLASPVRHGGGGPLAVEGAPVTCMTFLQQRVMHRSRRPHHHAVACHLPRFGRGGFG